MSNCHLACHNCPVSAGQRAQKVQTRSRSKSEDEWLIESSGLAVAYELFENGKISNLELAQIVAQDRLWHTGERVNKENETMNPYFCFNDTEIVGNNEDDNEEMYDIEAQVTDADLGLGTDIVVDLIDDNESNNSVDPLTLEVLGPEEQIFTFREKTKFNADSLYDYIYQTNSYIDPITRLEYTDEELHEISRLCKISLGLLQPVSNLVTKKHSKINQNLIEEEKLRQSAVNGIENILDNVVSDIRDCIQGYPMSPQCSMNRASRSIRLVTQLYPHFNHAVEQLKMLDTNQTKSCLNIYLTQVKGHPKRPTHDPYNLLNGVIDHLQACLNIIMNDEELEKVEEVKEVEQVEEVTLTIAE
jgi:hypothetical protein